MQPVPAVEVVGVLVYVVAVATLDDAHQGGPPLFSRLGLRGRRMSPRAEDLTRSPPCGEKARQNEDSKFWPDHPDAASAPPPHLRPGQP